MGCASSKTAEDKADESKPNRKSNINKSSSGSNSNGKLEIGYYFSLLNLWSKGTKNTLSIKKPNVV
jgi:hypothetical protein